MVAQGLILAQEAEFKIGLVHSKVQASQGYTVSLSKKKKKKIILFLCYLFLHYSKYCFYIFFYICFIYTIYQVADIK